MWQYARTVVLLDVQPFAPITVLVLVEQYVVLVVLPVAKVVLAVLDAQDADLDVLQPALADVELVAQAALVALATAREAVQDVLAVMVIVQVHA